MDLRDIEYFAAIAEHRHIGRAAETLGLGQPALSISLRRLESAAGAKLVHRTPRGVELTEVGSALLAHVGRLRLARQDLAREIADLARGEAGTLRIGASPSNALAALPEVCSMLLADSPQLSLRVAVHDNEALLPALQKGELDVVIGHRQQFADPDLTEITVQQDQFVVYCAAAHPLAARRSLQLKDLVKERWVATEANAHAPWLSLRQFFAQHGLPPPKIALASSSPALNLRAVASSRLLGVSNRRVVAATAALHGLVILRVSDLEWFRDAVVVHRKDAYLSPVARRFIEAMKTVSAKTGLASAPVAVGSPTVQTVCR
jgi:DNA-binding transcriptional LysR family regulator